MCLALFLMSISLMFGKTTSAHNVLYFTPPCFLQGTTATIQAQIANAASGSYFHWQFKATPASAWTYLANGNNTINGRTFSVTNASFVGAVTFPSGGAQLSPVLSIANVGSPAYTTQLDNVEFRLIMTDGLDPQTNPGASNWGGESSSNPFEAKTVRLLSRPATDNCYSNCIGNVLVTNPAAVPPPLADYYGGFEVGAGGGTNNFFAVSGTNCTTNANTDLTQWTVSPLATAARYRVINNPDSMNAAFRQFAPHTGKQMMVVSRLQSATSRAWYRTIVVPTAAQFFNGQITLKAWFAKVDTTTVTATVNVNPTIVFEVKGSTAFSGSCGSSTFVTVAGGLSTGTTVTGPAGTWVQKSFTLNVTGFLYKRLEISIKSTNATATTPVSFAIDDICLLEPAGATLPVQLTGLNGNYSGGVAHLNWSTKQEVNSSHFEIERSTDGVNFNNIGKVYAKGNSNQEVTYKFDDIKVAAGINYYRLRMVDKDGRFEYSNTVALDVKIKGLNITGIYPNPFADKLSVSIASESSTTATIRLFDNTGRVVARQQAIVSKGVTTIPLESLGNLAKGFYIIEVKSGETVLTQKLIK